VHIVLIYGEGWQRQGLLLAGSGDRMRVMLPGMADVVELRRIDGVWLGESGAAAEIGAAACLETTSGEWFERPARQPIALTI
jgi:hypothetical protein